MEKPIKIFSVLFAFLVMLTQCASYRSNDTFALCFNNFNYDTIALPDEFFIVDSPMIPSKTVFVYNSPLLYKGGELVSDAVINALLDLKMTYYWSSEEEYDRKLLDKNDYLYILGRIRLSENFDSYLIRTENSSERSKGKTLFVLNAKGNRLLSIFIIGAYSLSGINSFCIWTVAKHHDEYLQKSKTLTSDVIEPWYYRKNKVTKGHRFKIDSNGYIVVCE